MGPRLMDENINHEGDLFKTSDLLSDLESEGKWPAGRCTICNHQMAPNIQEVKDNCPNCDSRPRTRTLPIIEHYLSIITPSNLESAALGVSMTKTERDMIDRLFRHSKSISLFGDYFDDNISGIDVRNLSMFTDNSFSGLFSCLVFDYFSEQKLALQESHRVIEPKGLLITHMADSRLLDENIEPYVESYVESQKNYFEYIGESRIPSIKVGIEWFLDEMKRAGFQSSRIDIKEPMTNQRISWFIGREN